MKRGDIVEWLDPLSDDETLEVFRVLEVRGDRVLVEDAVWPCRITPTYQYNVSDLRVRQSAQ